MNSWSPDAASQLEHARIKDQYTTEFGFDRTENLYSVPLERNELTPTRRDKGGGSGSVLRAKTAIISIRNQRPYPQTLLH